MSFQPCGLNGDNAIGRCMGLIKGIGGKCGHFIKELIGNRFGNAVADTSGNEDLSIFLKPVNEDFTFLGHDIVFFLGHGTPNQVTAAIGISGKVTDDLHDLFLIDDTAVSDGKDRAQGLVQVLDALGILPVLDVHGNGIHGAGAIEGDSRNDILEILRTHVAEKASHPCRFELEDPVRIAV